MNDTVARSVKVGQPVMAELVEKMEGIEPGAVLAVHVPSSMRPADVNRWMESLQDVLETGGHREVLLVPCPAGELFLHAMSTDVLVAIRDACNANLAAR